MNNNEETKPMTLDQFQTTLDRLDWTYNRSDDPRTYSQGLARFRDAQDMANSLGGEWLEAFRETHKAKLGSYPIV